MIQGDQDITRSRTEALVGHLRRLRFRSRLLRRPLVWARQRGLNRDDILLASYPRSGTTWLRFLLTEVLTGEPAEFERVGRTVRYVGDHRNAPRLLPNSGRVIFSHEAYEKADHRVVYAVRDPRSVVVSEFRWLLRRGLYFDDFSEFFSDFLAGKTNPWGRWSSHINYWLASPSASSDRVHVVKFEDLRADAQGSLRDILTFLDVKQSDDRIEAAVQNNSVGEMRTKEERAPGDVFSKGVKRDIRFVNTGTTLGWKETLTGQQVAKLETEFGELMVRLGYDLVS
jgi:Sulfotransferase domain